MNRLQAHGVVNRFIPVFLISFLLFIRDTYAHCPLCTLGAVAVAGGAAWLGVSHIVIGLFIGAFAVSLGWWFSGILKKSYFRYQKLAIILFFFLTTVLPLLPLIKAPTPYPLYISFFGEYGSMFNRTYLFNLFLVGSIIGGLIVSLTPSLSKAITSWRKGKTLPYQGLTLTFILLITSGIFLQWVV